MKIHRRIFRGIFLFVVSASALPARGGSRLTGNAGGFVNPAPPSQLSSAIAQQQFQLQQQALAKEEQEKAAAEKRAEQLRLASWMPSDPWRLIDGKTNWAKGPGWMQFVGKVVEVQPTGIRVEGSYNLPGETHYDSENYNYRDFFVADFPYSVAEGDVIGLASHLTALEDGTYTYSTVTGGGRTIHKLRYGAPCAAPPPSPEFLAAQQAAEKAKADAAKKAREESDARTLKWNEDQAAQGDPYGLLRMGERYAVGDGVAKDLKKAREYLTRSASLGNDAAKEELSKLSTTSDQ